MMEVRLTQEEERELRLAFINHTHTYISVKDFCTIAYAIQKLQAKASRDHAGHSPQLHSKVQAP